jgi:hypothetical protein
LDLGIGHALDDIGGRPAHVVFLPLRVEAVENLMDDGIDHRRGRVDPDVALVVAAMDEVLPRVVEDVALVDAPCP